MARDRAKLVEQGLLDVLQPVPYGGAFAKVHAWDPAIFAHYEKVVLVDGDILAVRSVRGLLELEPLAASRDVYDAFNYGVLVLRPDAAIHQALVRLLTEALPKEIRAIQGEHSRRSAEDLGFCDQTLVAGYLAKHHGPIHFFEDLRGASRKKPKDWLLSTEFNMVVSYNAKERCESREGRRRVEKARLVHFANNWLNFARLADDREAPGRIDSPRCYQGAFRYWHDVHKHALAQAAAGSGAAALPAPEYAPTTSLDELGEALPEDVLRVFEDFRHRLGLTREDAAEDRKASTTHGEL